MSGTVNAVIILFVLVFWFLIIRKFLVNSFATVKEVNAKVVDKYKSEFVKYYGAFKRERYIVVFEIKEKRVSFAVSEFSYGNYNVNQKGILKYKGTRIISFNS